MFEYLLKKLVDLVGDSLDWARLRTWLKSLRWRTRLAILGLAGLLILGAYYWTSLPLIYVTSLCYLKVATVDPAIIPLRSSLKLKLHATAERLSEGLRPDLEDTSRIDPPSAWTVAQLAAAVGRTDKVDPDRIRTYLRNIEIACDCWQERPDITSLPNVAVSGWVFFALAELDLPATESEVRFILAEQNKRQGWWSVFQASDDEANASTFGTSWALLGLQNQLRKQLIPKVLMDDTLNAVRKGSSCANYLVQQGVF